MDIYMYICLYVYLSIHLVKNIVEFKSCFIKIENLTTYNYLKYIKVIKVYENTKLSYIEGKFITYKSYIRNTPIQWH